MNQRAVFFDLETGGLSADYHVLDTMVLAGLYAQLTGTRFPNLKLQTIAQQFGLGGDQAHEALDDVRTAIAIYRRMVGDLRALISPPNVPVNSVNTPPPNATGE
jgi:DNA polymerase III epsilon subunit-like protein